MRSWATLTRKEEEEDKECRLLFEHGRDRGRAEEACLTHFSIGTARIRWNGVNWTERDEVLLLRVGVGA